MILLPKPAQITNKKDNSAVFEIESLYPGYGITIGNSLRRVLLSSLPGAAVTQMKIKGVQHEFSTLKGVLEDVITIGMNLKQLRFKMLTPEPQKAVLKVKGEKEAKGSDFEIPGQMELLNKDAHIATLTDKNTDLEIEILVESGLGYEPVESRKKQGKLEIGVIQIDAIFTPIKRVNYKVENMRVGERTDFDRLAVEIETDGSISPEDAFKEAGKILVDHFNVLIGAASEQVPAGKEEGESEEGGKKDVLKTKISELDLSGRISGSLAENNIKTVAGLVKKTEEDLLGMEGMGEKAVEEIKKTLKKMGLELKS